MHPTLSRRASGLRHPVSRAFEDASFQHRIKYRAVEILIYDGAEHVRRHAGQIWVPVLRTSVHRTPGQKLLLPAFKTSKLVSHLLACIQSSFQFLTARPLPLFFTCMSPNFGIFGTFPPHMHAPIEKIRLRTDSKHQLHFVSLYHLRPSLT